MRTVWSVPGNNETRFGATVAQGAASPMTSTVIVSTTEPVLRTLTSSVTSLPAETESRY